MAHSIQISLQIGIGIGLVMISHLVNYELGLRKNAGQQYFKLAYLPYKEKYLRDWFKYDDGDGRLYRKRWRGKGVWEKRYLDESKGEPASTVAEVQQVYANPQAYKEDRIGSQELIGYPTQKPEALFEHIVNLSCPESGVIADFFCGGESWFWIF